MGKEVVQGIGIGLVAIVIVVSIGSFIGTKLSGHHGGDGHGGKKGDHKTQESTHKEQEDHGATEESNTAQDEKSEESSSGEH